MSCVPSVALAVEGDGARTTATNTEQAASANSLTNEASDNFTTSSATPDIITINGANYVPCYAALTYAEYWAAEGVQAAGSDISSDKKDSCEERDEYDCGAFDAVSRATANHGLHRGNFQGSIVLYADNGQDYVLDHWSDDGKSMVLADGTEVPFARGMMTLSEGEGGNAATTTAKMVTYDNIGLRYVPVAVPADDWDEFAAAYTVVTNGEDMAGGYAEAQLSSYKAVANVAANTNGLKIATKTTARDGSSAFAFGPRQTGEGTGLSSLTLSGGKRTEAEPVDTAKLRTLDKSTVTTKIQADTTYGDFIRMDILGDYGDLGGAMTGVKWTYYGNDSAYAKPLATYGTKFAADNWMHKSNGIQLGLTLSERCALPTGTDGSGYWRVTVYAMGFTDTDFDIHVAPSDLRIPGSQADLSAVQAKAAAAKPLVTDVTYTAESRKALGELVASAEKATLGTWEPYKREFVALGEAIDSARASLVKTPAAPAPAIPVATQKISLAKAKVTGLSAKAYTGKALRPTVKVTLGGKTLKEGTDYAVTYRSNKAVGKAKVAITGKGSYTGSLTKTFTINPAKQKISKVSKAKKAFTAKWKKAMNATSYQVQYSTNKNFKKAVTKTVKKKSTSYKATRLKTKTTYYVRVRTVTKVGKTTYKGAWSAAKTVKTK